MDLDFNNDKMLTTADIVIREQVEAGAECAECDSLDFDGDGVDDSLSSYLSAWARTPTTLRETYYVLADDETECPPGFSCVLHFKDAERRLNGRGGTILFGPGVHTDEFVGGGWYNNLHYGGTRVTPLVIGSADPKRRAVLRLPKLDIPAVRMAGITDVTVRDLIFECREPWTERRDGDRVVEVSQGGFIISGASARINILNCKVVRGGMGVVIQGDGPRRPTDIYIEDSTFWKIRQTAHSQGIYAAAYGRIYVLNNSFIDIGKPGSIFDQGCYFVHDAQSEAVIHGNFFVDIANCGIQFRGGRTTITSNVVGRSNCGIGVSHPMGLAAGVYTNSLVSGNYVGDLRGAAQWGYMYGGGRDNTIVDNEWHNVARPFMSFHDQGLTHLDLGVNHIMGNRETDRRIDWDAEIERRLRD